ncbi:MED6 mediator sub complex component-domain-containing protein [Pseudomassariella vexata]|uniref:Mediator of RNA polymerase II transcription subunit 6 n=1 Tax=Pseudomassariella vexata TaxID=1141098 RepID=A0A1Y2EJB9_9PEZI|nr:MED6 mediator sub complex component-domain-containing protein [Pseudomassariella vexata]ORY71567.1 MED6 mediator sub complex component-domain-containing protein [Pseudomassariella vexata]
MAGAPPPLDETQWRDPHTAASMQGIHSNSVLHYFAASPFSDPTSNNAVIITQSQWNRDMHQYLVTRDAFEGRLKTMSGLEYIVAQEPSVMGPGAGTGVWVIRKQTRRKRANEEDEITVHSSYFVVGDNIYMAPTLADIMSYRMATVESKLRKCFPVASEVSTWSPAAGHAYTIPTTSSNPRERTSTSKEATPMPDGESHTSKAAGVSESKKPGQSTMLDARLAEQSFTIHMQYGSEYMDENPITGKPGEFHLSSTGRKDRMVQAPGNMPSLTTSFKSPTVPDLGGKRDVTGKGDKTPKTPTSGPGSKPKRKKSKAGTTPGTTPTAS